MTFFSFLCRLTRKISAHESPYLTASAEARVESLTTANQLAGRRFGIRQLAEDNGTSKQAIGVVLGIPLASTPTTLNLKVQERMKILVLNSGSSSQKACLYEIAETLPDNPPACLWEGKIEWLGDSSGVTQNRPLMVTSKPAIKRNDTQDIDSDESLFSLCRHEQCLERTRETASLSTGAAGMVLTAHRAGERCTS